MLEEIERARFENGHYCRNCGKVTEHTPVKDAYFYDQRCCLCGLTCKELSGAKQPKRGFFKWRFARELG